MEPPGAKWFNLHEYHPGYRLDEKCQRIEESNHYRSHTQWWDEQEQGNYITHLYITCTSIRELTLTLTVTEIHPRDIVF